MFMQTDEFLRCKTGITAKVLTLVHFLSLYPDKVVLGIILRQSSIKTQNRKRKQKNWPF